MKKSNRQKSLDKKKTLSRDEIFDLYLLVKKGNVVAERKLIEEHKKLYPHWHPYYSGYESKEQWLHTLYLHLYS